MFVLRKERFMGASGWEYFTPWQKDVRRAFEVLQDEQTNEEGGDLLAAFEKGGEDGTHSILDIMGGISPKSYDERDESDLMMAFATPESALQEMYGTTRPTRKMVEENPFGEHLDRWTAVYFPVWDDAIPNGDPAWWYFAGCSGD